MIGPIEEATLQKGIRKRAHSAQLDSYPRPTLQHNIVRTSTIVFLGASTETGNRGVSALAEASIELLSEFFPDHSIINITPGRESILRLHHAPKPSTNRARVSLVTFSFNPIVSVRSNAIVLIAVSLLYGAVPLRFIRETLKNHFPLINLISTARFAADIWGGDSFSDIYGLSRMLKRAVGSLLCVFVGTRLILLPQTYGPYTTRTSRILAEFILARATMVFSRSKDKHWLERLTRNSGAKTEFCPDVAFTLSPKAPDHPLAPTFATDVSRPTVGINVSGLLYWGGYTQDNMFGLRLDYRSFVETLCAELIVREHCQVLLVPHTYRTSTDSGVENDLVASRAVSLEVKNLTGLQPAVLEVELEPRELKYVIGQFDFFVASRLHACIAGLSQGVPTVGIAYSKKFWDVFDSIGELELLIDGRRVTTETAIMQTFLLIEDKEQIRPRVAQAASRARHDVKREMRFMEQWL